MSLFELPRSICARHVVLPSRRPPLRIFLIVSLALPALVVGERAFAGFADPSAPTGAPLEIVTPAGAGPIGDGNLILVEAKAVDQVDGVVDRVEMAFDSNDAWVPAQQSSDDPARWRVIWANPAPGNHQIRARAFGVERQPVVEQSAVVDVQDVASTSYLIDNPYAGPGSFRKGELHMHSTSSFDGWNSLPPAQDALAYKAKGYQFVAITDHDVISYPQEVNDASFIVIPGYESTADSGHITAPFASSVVAPDLPPQQRIDEIAASGGLPILAHPGWRIGWSGTDFAQLRGYRAIEIFNGVTSDPAKGAADNLKLWQGVLNEKGYQNRVWAVAVDDSHQPDATDRGWVMVKSAELSADAIKGAMINGAMYASNGPSFSTIGVMGGGIAAVSPDAAVIRYFDQNGTLLLEGPGALSVFRPSGKERWVRVEAVMADGRTAWSQPFWIMPNAPRVAFQASPLGAALTGQTLPGARVHVADGGRYLGSVVAGDDGSFSYSGPGLGEGEHEFWLMATAPWPDQVDGPPALLSATDTTGASPLNTIGRWILDTPLSFTRAGSPSESSSRS
jgi:hypothetical protein